jgi:hypothetical protein
MAKPTMPGGEVPDFTPVPRRSDRHDGWSAECQRGFIAALAELGSVSAACQRVGMAKCGVYALRRAAGAESFRAAWREALDIGAQRLADIAMERAIEGVAVPIMYRGEQVGERRHYNDRLLTFMLQHHQPDTYGGNGTRRLRGRSTKFDDGEEEVDHQDYLGGMERIQQRLTHSRRLLLAGIADDPARRAAWETLVGPVDWDKAARLEAQADEPFGAPGEAGGQSWSMRRPDMLMVVEAGLAPDLTGGKDGLAPIAAELERLNAAARGGPPDEEPSEEEAAAVAAYRAGLIADGWTEDEHGNLFSPLDD